MAFIIYTVLVLVCCVPAREYIYKINIDDLSQCISTLLSVSSIIFTVVGVWLALIYPSAIQRIVTKISEVNFTEKETGRLSDLIEISITSALILAVIVLISLIKPLIPNNIGFLNLMLFIFLSICSLMQIHSILKVVLMSFHFLTSLRNKNSQDFERNIYK